MHTMAYLNPSTIASATITYVLLTLALRVITSRVSRGEPPQIGAHWWQFINGPRPVEIWGKLRGLRSKGGPALARHLSVLRISRSSFLIYLSSRICRLFAVIVPTSIPYLKSDLNPKHDGSATRRLRGLQVVQCYLSS